MSKEWYDIDVKKEVIKDLKNYMRENQIDASSIDKLSGRSVRDLMDAAVVSALPGIPDPEAFAEYAVGRYMYYRKLKYGQKFFWDSAANERSIGYKNRWYQYVSNMLGKYCNKGDNVFFVGTADGQEIPDDHFFQYYALEQIGASVNKIEKSKIVECYEGDFEDESLVINGGNYMHAIVALRCLMPNTRLDRFFKFVENNIVADGVLVVSHPMGYLNAEGVYGKLPDCEKTKEEFEDRLHGALHQNPRFYIEEEKESDVEYFYMIRVNGGLGL